MQNRTAIILSLGMLLEKVDTSGFIVTLLKKAKEENAEFAFTAELQKQAFLLSENFNQGKVEPEAFEAQLLQLLAIKTMQSSEFWSEWGNMLKLGEVAEKIQLMEEVGYEHNALVYLSSDTNNEHLKKIAKECEEQKMTLDLTKQPMLFAELPLYASCRVGKNRQELTKHIVRDIRSKEFNKPDAIILILGNPENIKDKSHQAVAKREFDAIAAWCEENGVTVKLHNQSLDETLAQIFTLESAATNTLNFCS
ncbi:MAG: hypothetical protein SFW66_09440 [Gammaproteobacteria bacterium]|nr:hypothetical protein [Gammaproteobacteria bacterium]